MQENLDLPFDDLRDTALSAEPFASPSRRLKAAFMASVVVVALMGYSLTGSPSRNDVSTLAPAGNEVAVGASSDPAAAPAEDQTADIVERLAQRLNGNPDDASGWTLLARAYSAMGRYDEAVQAYQKALPLAVESADLLADYADAIIGKNGGRLNAEATRQVSRALSLDANNPKSLALAGRAAFDAGDFAAAVQLWEKVAALLPPDSPIRAPLQESLAQARELGGGISSATRAKSSDIVRPETISGRVRLEPRLSAKATPGDTVFVFAQAESGSRLPLAVLRAKVSDLPLSFSLDDNMAMSSGAKISDHAKVVVSARISRSGNATPQAGDLTGQSKPVTPGTRQLDIRISDEVSNTAVAAREKP